MTTLFELTKEQQQVLNLVENGSLSQEEVADTLEALQMEIEDKVTAYCHVNRKLSSELEMLVNEEKRIKELKSQKQNEVSRLKQQLKLAMQNAGMAKIDVGLFKVSTRKGVDSVNVIDQDKLPSQFLKTTVAPDKTAIKAALKAGEKLDGAELVAGESSLIIK